MSRGARGAGRALRNREAAPLALPRFRSPLVFGALALLFAILLGRSLYLQWFDNEFLQGQGTARHSRELEVPAHRGRIVDRTGEALALSTPVKSLWAFPDKFDATPEQVAALAAILETTPQKISARLDANEDFAFIAKQVAPEVAERAMALRIPGLHDQNEYRRFYPGGEVTAQIVGFTGDHDVGQEGIELAQQAWLAGIPGSRRVIINRRNEAVEDVAAIRAPQAGHDLALSIDARLQYLAFRELKAAIELNQAKAGGLVILDVKTGEILALANWPTYNPNSRNKVTPAMMRNRALTDTFEPGFDDEAVHDRGGARGGPRATGHRDRDGAGHADDRLRDDPRRASGRHAHRRAGDPEVLERRRGQDRARPAVGDAVGNVLERRLRHAAQDRLSRRAVRTAASGEVVAADRAGDDVVRARHLGQPGAAGARVHDVRHRRRSEGGDACSRPTASSRDGRCCSPRRRAPCATCWNW